MRKWLGVFLSVAMMAFHVPNMLSAVASAPFVTCELQGQLGNQFFEIATTLAYAWDYHAEPIFPDLNRSEWDISMNRDRVFFRLNSSSLPRPVLNTFDDTYERWQKYSRIPFKLDQQLKGIFLNWKNFHHHREKLLEVFAPSQDIKKYLQKKYGWLLAYPKTVSVHVRTYNKEWHKKLPFLGLEYYEKAMNLFPEDTLFVVFSDRPNWCKHHFKRFKKAIIVAEGNDHIQDFFLMSMLKDHIVGNSTYSWWAAYLDNKPGKVVVIPKYWFRFPPQFLPFPDEKDDGLSLPGWVVIDNNLDTSFPEDMTQYDTYSRSVDTQ